MIPPFMVESADSPKRGLVSSVPHQTMLDTMCSAPPIRLPPKEIKDSSADLPMTHTSRLRIFDKVSVEMGHPRRIPYQHNSGAMVCH